MSKSVDSPIIQRLVASADAAYRVDSRYAEQVLLAANTVQLKRNTWANRKENKATGKIVQPEAAAIVHELLDLDAAV